MAIKEIQVEHTHIPEVSIPEGDRSYIESRAVVLSIGVAIGRRAVKDVVVNIITGNFTLHKNLAGQVADKLATKFDLPETMPYESAVLIGLITEDGQTSVFSTTHGTREKAPISDDDAYGILHLAAAGIAMAILRGRKLDTAEPPQEPYDMDQLPEPIYEEFDVTSAMLAEFDSDIRDGVIILHEEISHSPPKDEDLSPKSGVVSKIKAALTGLTVGDNPFADD